MGGGRLTLILGVIVLPFCFAVWLRAWGVGFLGARLLLGPGPSCCIVESCLRLASLTDELVQNLQKIGGLLQSVFGRVLACQIVRTVYRSGLDSCRHYGSTHDARERN
jgi:hypothetical protein